MSPRLFFLLWLLGEILSYALGTLIAFSTYFYRRSGKWKMPDYAKPFFDESTTERSNAYYEARFWHGQRSALFFFVLEILFVLVGYYPWLYRHVSFGSGYMASVLFLTLMGIPRTLLELPFSLYQEFGIEKRFGFSTTTGKLWLADLAKNAAISLVLSLVLYGVLVLLLFQLGNAWWIVAGCFLVLFSLAFTVVYPLWIAPLFNKFTPLEEGTLRTKLSELLASDGFSLKKVFVVDESKRSKHSNAYCSGFGRNKRIVLYDSLLKTLTEEEIVAVFAHELGHAKKRHVLKRLLSTYILLFLLLYFASLFLHMDALYEVFRFEESANAAIGLFLVFLVFGNYPVFLSWIGCHFSRKDEKEADLYAKERMGSGEPLASALMKLQAQNLSNNQPSPLEVFFTYSHPTVFMRLEYLLK